MTDLLICSIKSPQCTDKNSNFFFDSDSPSLCFDVQKASNFTSGGVQKQDTRNDCDVISGLQASRKTDFSNVFLIFVKNKAKLYNFLAN